MLNQLLIFLSSSSDHVWLDQAALTGIICSHAPLSSVNTFLMSSWSQSLKFGGPSFTNQLWCHSGGVHLLCTVYAVKLFSDVLHAFERRPLLTPNQTAESSGQKTSRIQKYFQLFMKAAGPTEVSLQLKPSGSDSVSFGLGCWVNLERLSKQLQRVLNVTRVKPQEPRFISGMESFSRSSADHHLLVCSTEEEEEKST